MTDVANTDTTDTTDATTTDATTDAAEQSVPLAAFKKLERKLKAFETAESTRAAAEAEQTEAQKSDLQKAIDRAQKAEQTIADLKAEVVNTGRRNTLREKAKEAGFIDLDDVAKEANLAELEDDTDYATFLTDLADRKKHWVNKPAEDETKSDAAAAAEAAAAQRRAGVTLQPATDTRTAEQRAGSRIVSRLFG